MDVGGRSFVMGGGMYVWDKRFLMKEGPGVYDGY